MAADLKFSTEHVPERMRFDQYRDTVTNVLGFVPDARSSTDSAFRASIERRRNGPLQTVRCDLDPHGSRRDRMEINQHPLDCFGIFREGGQRGTFVRFRTGDYQTKPGDIAVFDFHHNLRTDTNDRYKFEMMLVPRTMLAPYLPRQVGGVFMPLSGRAGAQSLASAYVEGLWREWDNLTATQMAQSADVLARLIGIAAGVPAQAVPEAAKAGRLAQVLRHIDRHLADPVLSPATAAAALKISVRVLHQTFEGSGMSFASRVRRRRLEECRTALLANPTRPVTDIAFAWGFSSLSAFYRAFQETFGQAPGDLRTSGPE